MQSGDVGLNKKTNGYYFQFINEGGKVGFERNSDNMGEYTLMSKDEVCLKVSSNTNHFMDHWTFSDGDTKKWIEWAGPTYTDTGIHETVHDQSQDGNIYNLKGQRVEQPQKGIYINNGKKYIAK